MNEMNNQEPWTDIFKKCLGDLKEKNPRLSLSQLASKVDMARSTLNDHCNSRNGASRPNLDTYIKVVLESGNISMFFEALTAYDDKLAKNLKTVLSVSSAEKDAVIPTNELETVLDDRSTFIAYISASNSKGVNKRTLAHILGNKGQPAINALVARKLVFIDGDSFKVKDPTVLVRSFESIKHHLTTYADYYKPHHVGQGRNYAASLSSSLNDAGIKASQDAHRAFHETMKNIMRNPDFEGNTPSFSVAFCDTFTDIDFDPNDGGELQ